LKFLDISLLKISECFSRNFTGYKKDVLYLIPEVINASGHSFSSIHTQPGAQFIQDYFIFPVQTAMLYDLQSSLILKKVSSFPASKMVQKVG
jgi:hypothetical protein